MRDVAVAVAGLGRVGQAFVRSIVRSNAGRSTPGDPVVLDLPFALRVHAVADRSGGLFAAHDADLERAVRWKESGRSLADLAPDQIVPSAGFLERLRSSGIELLVESLASRLEDGQPGLDLIEAVLAAGIHVVTVDKGPLVRGWERLHAVCRSSGAVLRASGTTGVVAPAGLERVLEIRGVLNGTTNFILNEMTAHSLSLASALEEARRLGLTEPDPGLDLEGWDTAIKIMLLARSLMGSDASLEDVARVGLGPGTGPLVENARATGRRVRLVGRARTWHGRLRLSVAPKIVGPDSPFFALDGTAKAAIFRTPSEERVAMGVSGPAATAIVMLRDIAAIYSPGRE